MKNFVQENYFFQMDRGQKSPPPNEKQNTRSKKNQTKTKNNNNDNNLALGHTDNIASFTNCYKLCGQKKKSFSFKKYTALQLFGSLFSLFGHS